MPHELIYSHGDIEALQARRSERGVLINLVSLESVRKAQESYALLRQLVAPRSWICPELELLSLMAGLALELHKIKDHMLPQLQQLQEEQEPVDPEALLLVKTSAIALLALGKDFKKALKQLGRSTDDEDLISPLVRELGVLLKDSAVQVLKNPRNIGFVKERVPILLGLVNALLETPVRVFPPDSE